MIEKIKLFLPCKSAEYIGQKGKQGAQKYRKKYRKIGLKKMTPPSR